MAKIVNVVVTEAGCVVSYESGVSRTYAKAPKTAMEWLAVNEDTTTEVAVNEDTTTEVAVKTPTISALDVILDAAFTIMPSITEVATQALMAIIIGLLMAGKGARRIGKTLIPWVLWITGGVVDLLIDVFYTVTLVPTMVYTIYNVVRYKVAPLVMDTISYGWNLRAEIIAENK